MYIDSHAHGFHAERNKEGKLVLPLLTTWNEANGSPEYFLEKYRNNGIEKAVFVDPPEVCFKLKEIFGDFVIPIIQVDIDKTSPKEINSYFQQGAKGIKFIAPGKSYGDDAYMEIYDTVKNNNGLAVFHTGFVGTGLYEPGCILGRKSVIDIDHMRPVALDRIARYFPELKILMAHFGNPWWEEAWKISSSHKNIYADFSGGTAKWKPMEMWKQMFCPNGQLHYKSLEKLCFGSDDSYFLPEHSSYLKSIEFYERFYDVLNLPEELRLKINKLNILSILN
jgi:uncharacterized protein